MTAAAHLDFSLRLHHNLAPPVNESFCWSPYSVFSALGLTAEAVAGETREELRAALGGELADQRRLATTAATLDDVGRTRERPELGVANTLWADQGLPVTESYLRELKEWPGSAVRTTSFRTDPESARRAINADISETTRGLIPELLRPGTVHPDTVAALVNALYLKTSWQQAFDSADTRKRVFHAPDEDHDVPMMRTTRELRYVAARGWQAVALPALGGVEAVVLLPDADRDPAGALRAAEPELSAARLDELLGGLGKQRVELALPRLDVSGEAELRGPLGALGVRTVFTPAADFSPLTGSPLRVSTLVHQAVLRVDENGLEGAAATAAMMRLTSVTTQPKAVRVTVDRPFWLLVRHRETGMLYFLARVADPKSST